MCTWEMGHNPNLPKGMNKRTPIQLISENAGSSGIKLYERPDAVYSRQIKAGKRY
jgi:hypothetical protein